VCSTRASGPSLCVRDLQYSFVPPRPSSLQTCNMKHLALPWQRTGHRSSILHLRFAWNRCGGADNALLEWRLDPVGVRGIQEHFQGREYVLVRMSAHCSKTEKGSSYSLGATTAAVEAQPKAHVPRYQTTHNLKAHKGRWRTRCHAHSS